MSKTYLISDTHHGHEKILQYCSRPFKDTKEMTYEIITRHNKVVTNDDVVWHLGDIFWGDNWKQLAGIMKRLNGKSHHLVLGNHDHMNAFNYVEAGFTSVHTSFMLEDFLLIHDPAVFGVIKNLKGIHGHTHDLSLQLSKNTFCVCVELHNYTPVDFEYIKKFF